MKVRTVLRIGRVILPHLNVLQSFGRLSPGVAFGTAFVAGVLLCIYSREVGIASFKATIQVVYQGGEKTLPLELGFLQQLNYGPWYFLPAFCPALFLLVGFAFEASRTLSSRYSVFAPTFDDIGKRWWVALAGLVIAIFFIGKNIYVEFQDYKSLGLGWVQAEALQAYRGRIQSSGHPIDLVAEGKHFDQFLLDEKHFVRNEEIQHVWLLSVDPRLAVRDHFVFLVFIGVAKFWVGFWEALVTYLAFISGVWGFEVLVRFRPQMTWSPEKQQCDLIWFWKPAFFLFLVGVWTNMFCVFRFNGNAIKGSYGKWDQYWSIITLSPGCVALVVWVFICQRVYLYPSLEKQPYTSKGLATVATLWITSTAFIVSLLFGYLDPVLESEMVSSLQPFSAITKLISPASNPD